MVPIEKILDLTNEEFMAAYVSSELNSLDLPAREYFARQEVIRSEMQRRITEEDLDPLRTVLMTVPNVEESDNANFRAHLLLYASEGEQPNFVVCQDEKEVLERVHDFQQTGRISYMNPASGYMSEKEVSTVAHIVTQKMWKRKGFKEIKKEI